MSYWREYWERRTDGGHRSLTDDFLQEEAREKLFHLAGGESLLDFVCGSADLLRYYSGVIRKAVGVDLSPALFRRARESIETRGQRNVALVCADDVTAWGKTPQPHSFDGVTVAAVVLNPLRS